MACPCPGQTCGTRHTGYGTTGLPMATVWCQALLRPGDDYKDEICGDLRIFDQTGQLVAEIRGVRLKHIGGETLQRLARTSMIRQQEEGSLSRDRLLTAEPGEQQSLLETYLCIVMLPIPALRQGGSAHSP